MEIPAEPAPVLGTSTDKLMKSILGYSDERLSSLRRNGVI
jgi:hypothetical protein